MSSKSSPNGSFLSPYERFLIQNVETVATIENSLRTLLFFMPGRLRDSEIKLEVAYSAIGLLTWFNDITLVSFIQRVNNKIKGTMTNTSEKKNTATQQPEQMLPQLPPSDCMPFAKWLTFIRFIEILVEIIAKQKWGTEGKYKAVLLVESIKAILKLMLLKTLNGKMLLQNYISIPQLRDTEVMKALIAPLSQEKKDTKKRDRLNVSPAKWEKFKLNTGGQVTTTEKTEETSRGKIMAEILNILRPVIYLLSILKYGDRSWIPLLTSLGVDLASLSYYYSRLTKLTDVQQSEVTRRSFLLCFYLMRNPIFDSFTMRVLGRPKPVEGDEKQGMFKWALGSVRDYITVYQNYYFYTSGT